MSKTKEKPLVKARLHTLYQDQIIDQLVKTCELGNKMQAPKLTKIVLNMGVGEGTVDRKHIQSAVEDLALIAGQQPIVTRARQSEAGFKLRKNMAIGVKVTLRRRWMYEFIDRLIYVALPRQRDFRGLSLRSFDGHGNYSLGIKEHIVFPEINYDKVDSIRGLDVTICTNSDNDKHAQKLLEAFNFPFQQPRGANV